MKPLYYALVDLCKAVGLEPPDSVRADQQQASGIIAACIAAMGQGGGLTGDGWPDNIGALNQWTKVLHYSKTNEEAARSYFDTVQPAGQPTGCTAIVKNGILLRNLDWYYSNQLEMVVEVEATEDNLKYTGVAGGFSKLTASNFPGDDIPLLRVLPFQLQDGHNSAGVKACYNVTPLEEGEGMHPTQPSISEEDRVYALMLVSYVLRKFSTAKDAFDYITQHVSVWFPEALAEMQFGLQFIIADASDTFVVTLVDGELLERSTGGIDCVTNYRQNGVTFGEGGAITTPATQSVGHTAVTDNGIQAHGQGLERYMLVQEMFDGVTTLEEAKELMQKLYFFHAYTDSYEQPWYTEFTGGDLRVDSPPEAFTDILAAAAAAWEARDRDTPVVWQTTHCSIYASGSLFLATQEGSTFTQFTL